MIRILIILSLVSTFLIGCRVGENQIDLNLKTLPGIIVMRPPTLKMSEHGRGLDIYTPGENKHSLILKEQNIYNPQFNKDKSKIVALKQGDIVEYDLKNNVLKTLLKSNLNTSFLYVKYVPNRSEISFINDNRLYVYDIPSKITTYVTSVSSNYCWSEDGDTFIFSDQNQVYEFNVKDKSNRPLFKGYDPQYSNNNQYLAYLLDQGILIVKEIDTNREWKYKTNRIYHYTFSPDDSYVAVEQDSTKWLSTDKQLIIWDFKNGKSDYLISFIMDGLHGDFDWK
ncbi:MAG: hypothetical protein CVU89_17030 [Firmicutes bacterium HGW-Firmicutes-14]|nr:MAG: hypothetical protein CVU89_17030 [Firmicutes bacterium HGW-Firmicutes-14]